LSFEEEPHSSPGKLGELGLHVLLSPKKEDSRTERIPNVGRVLTFSAETPELKNGERHTLDSQREDALKPNESDNGEILDGGPRESMYVTAFNTAVDTVIESEGHLFSTEEINIIDLYRKLPCAFPFFRC
jgi:hypothetical protein